MPQMVYDVRDVRTIRELFESSAALYGERTAFIYKDKDKQVCSKTYSQAFEEMKMLSAYLNSRGFENKRIALMGHNCYEWALTYLAVCCGTGVIVPIDKELKAPEVQNILLESEAEAIIYTPDMANTLKDCDGSGHLERISTDEFPDILEIGKAKIDSGDKSYERHTIDPYAMGILLFTSGTTGMAKGVMLSQYNICSDVVNVRKGILVSPEDRTLSVLPLHHTYECTGGFLAVLYSGASIAYAENLRKVAQDLQLFSPTILIAVPLLLESIHKNIMKKVKSSKIGVLSLAAGKGAVAAAGVFNIDVRKKIFKQVHEVFGGRLTKIICGAAALSPEICRDFDTFGIPVYNGYGLTETSPVCIMHNDMVRDYETIGKPISGVSVKLDSINEEGIGEIAVKGPNVMLGYYKNQKETDKVLRDGWFYTGDLATVTPDGRYKIVGRIKNMIVTPNGKKIFPEEMEYYLEKSPYIKECMVYGDEVDQDVIVTAVILPDFEEIDLKMAELGIENTPERYTEELKKLLSEAVKAANANVPNYKNIRHFRIRRTDFEKTTTKKIKRNAPENQQGENK